METKVLITFVQQWLFPAMHEHDVDFYSGRILLYKVLDAMGYDPERLYKILPDDYRTKYKTTKEVVAYLTK